MMRRSDQTAEIGFFRACLAEDPDLVCVRVDLARALLAEGDLEGAVAEATAALAVDPSGGAAWVVRAAARKELCAFEAAAADFEQAAARSPARVSVLVGLAVCYAETGRLEDAERVLRRAVSLDPASAEAQANLGSVLVKLDRFEAAEAPCRAALALNPSLLAPRRNLSAILATRDPGEARLHRDTAYRHQQIFVERAPRAEFSVLILSAADAANVPLQHLLPRERVTRVTWCVEYATERQDRELPPHDVVFNAIGEPDFAPPLPDSVRRLLRETSRPVLNDPARVALTRRCDLPRLLDGIAGLHVPDACLHPGPAVPLAEILAGAGMRLPVLVRPVGSHGGAGLRRVEDAAQLVSGPSYVTRFVDAVSDDGWYRKYRVIFVDGRPYPYHLAISANWLVHYFSAGMESDPARCREEARFLDDPAAVLGAAAMRALGAVGERLGLDYAGVDFGLLPDGRLVMFEANATMLVHPERDPRFAYRDTSVRTIQEAFLAMLRRRMG